MKESTVFLASGTAIGTGLYSTIGGVGLVGSFGGIGIGMTPITMAGTFAGAAAYGAFKGIEEGDKTAFAAMGLGALGGVGTYATIGGMGLSLGGTAVGIGMGTMAAVGGIFGLGIYGVAKMLDSSQTKEPIAQVFDRMEDKICYLEAYTQAMLELDPLLSELRWLQQFSELEIEEEFQQLKAKVKLERDNSNQTDNNNFDTIEIPEEKITVVDRSTNNWQCSRILEGHTDSLNSIAISSNNDILASVSDDHNIILWNLSTGKQIYTFFGLPQEIRTVAMSSDGKRLITAGFDRKISYWDLEKKQYIPTSFAQNSYSPDSHDSVIYSLAFSPDEQTIISGSGDRTIRLWNRYTGRLKYTYKGHTDAVYSIAISSDSQIIASGSADYTIRLWNFNSPQQQSRVLVGHSRSVTSVAITKDAKLLISADLDGVIKIWQLATGKLLNTWQGHHSAIWSIAIDPDGREACLRHQNIVSGSVGDTVKIWCLKTGNLQATLAGSHPVCFSSDGKTLITGDRTHQIKIWHKIYGNLNNDSANINESILTGSWWQVLGVRPTASKIEVKQAFYRLAKKYHPDRNNSVTAKINMQTINIAYREFKLDDRS